MTAVLETQELGKRYRKRWALRDCTLSVPAGHVTGLVGPNGAGKTTLLNLAVGLLEPTAGTVEIAGGSPASGPEQLANVGFVAQDTPTYPGLSVADHLKLGAHLNPGWDAEVAERRIARLGLDPGQKAGKLSGGQRAQLALTLVASRVLVAGEVDALLGSHYQLTGPRRELAELPPGWEVISASHTDRQSTLLVRSEAPIVDQALTVDRIGLEDLVLAYMSQANAPVEVTRPALAVQR
jgi:ABC-2 type transport system ATP-binding protein